MAKIHTLNNGIITITVSEMGAELQSFCETETNLNYLWNADPAFWAKHSPVLFPIVGALKNNEYHYLGNTYHLPRHGFAREKVFTLIEQTNTCLSFRLISDDSTTPVFPFLWELIITYRLTGEALQVSYIVKNKGNNTMWFSLGAHPAFAVPLLKQEDYEDYYLQFNQTETLHKWPIVKEGLISQSPIPFLTESKDLFLKKELFHNDAIVLKDLQSDTITLRSHKTNKGITFQFKGFPYFGIWAAPNANFICLEPWCGIADTENSNQDITQKEGINRLDPEESFERSWSVTLLS